MRQYYLFLKGENSGPYTAEEIESSIIQQGTTADIHAWYDGLGDWTPLGQLPEFADFFTPVAPPPPPPTPKAPAAAVNPVASGVIKYKIMMKDQTLGPFTETEIKKIGFPAHAKYTPEGTENWQPLAILLGVKLEPTKEPEETDEPASEAVKELGVEDKKLTKNQKIAAVVVILLILAIGGASPFIVKYIHSQSYEKPVVSDTTDDSAPKKFRAKPYPFDGTLWKSGVLQVAFVDIGQGDGIFIRTPQDKRLVLDSGMGVLDQRSSIDWGEKMVDYMAGQSVRTLDYILLSHPDFDHVGGLVTVAQKVPFDNFIDPQPSATDPFYERLLNIVKANKKIKYMRARRGAKLPIDNECEFLVLGPKEEFSKRTPANDQSMVIRVTFGKHSFLLSGDAEKEPEKEMALYVRNYLKATVLKAGHHGSKTSSTALFVAAVDPEYGVISCSAGNSFGHPNQGVLDRYKQQLSKNPDPEKHMLRTDMQGTIEFYTDGNVMTIRTEKQADPKLIFQYVSPYTNKTGNFININKAGLDELQRIPTVGPSKAEKIIEYRKANGPFKKKEDLRKVKGFGEKTYEKIEGWITIGDE